MEQFPKHQGALLWFWGVDFSAHSFNTSDAGERSHRKSKAARAPGSDKAGLDSPGTTCSVTWRKSQTGLPSCTLSSVWGCVCVFVRVCLCGVTQVCHVLCHSQGSINMDRSEDVSVWANKGNPNVVCFCIQMQVKVCALWWTLCVHC